jgi:hypothetical protein
MIRQLYPTFAKKLHEDIVCRSWQHKNESGHL